MQVTRFTDGGFVVHRLNLDGMKSRFSIWVSAQGILQDAERFDAKDRAYRVKRNSYSWARLDGRTQILSARLLRDGPTPVPRHSDYGGSPWAP
jgi:hypothetical protein